MRQGPLKSSQFRCRHQADQSAISVPASTSEWVDRLYRLLHEWFDIEASDTLAQQAIQQTIDQWARLLTEAAFDDAITQDWISAWFKEKLEESRGLMHSQQNGITFAALAPLSGIPFRHVMILGLDHDAFQGFENARHLTC